MSSSNPTTSTPHPVPSINNSLPSSTPHSHSDSESDSDEEDSIEHEIPIYLSHALGKNLHLFQFPVTDNVDVPERAAEKGWKISARWKPVAKRFEMEVSSSLPP